MTSEEKRIAYGLLFCPGDPELKSIKRKTHNLSVDFNMLYEDETEKRNQIMQEMFCEFGEGSFMQGPIFIHYGKHTTIGKNNCFNFRTTIQDDASVTIGDHCDFGPGLHIGDGCVIGAGSVVTRDIPERSFAAGVPCRVIRKLTKRDSVINMPERLGGYTPVI